MRDSKEILQQYISDMIALDGHIIEAVERQLEDKRVGEFPEARQVISTIKRTLNNHVDGLKGQLSSLGGEESGPVKEALSTIAGVAAGLYDKVRHDPVSKMLRDDYTALSLTSIAYTMLHTTGLALKNDAIADMALGYLMDVTPIVIDISKAVPGVVVKDLQDQEAAVDSSSAQEAVRRTQEAWSGENTM
jgi:hypothetical protein